MEAQILTEKQIKSFIAFLHTEEKSKHTIKKYSRDIKVYCQIPPRCAIISKNYNIILIIL